MKKTTLIFIKIAALLLGIAAILFLSLFLIYNSPLPQGEMGKKADTLALNISKNLGYEAFQKTNFLSWEVRNYSYLWDRKQKKVTIKWNHNHLIFYPNTPNNSLVITPKNCSKQQRLQLISTAQKKFNNDSFWLIAPFKFFDPNVERRYIPATKHESESLLITYMSGGTTPGDSYQWFVNDNYRPTYYKMWVKIIPIGGLPANWSHWKKTKTGAVVAHKKTILGVIPFPMTAIKMWNTK